MMFYHFGFILVLASVASGQDWVKRLRVASENVPIIQTTTPATQASPSYEYLTTVPDNLISRIPPINQVPPGSGDFIVLGYEPVYGYREVNSTDVSTEAPTLSKNWSFRCPRRFGYYRYQQSCDIYIECRNYRETRKVCPDGMHFKENPSWAEYPCAYPPEAKCLIRGGALPPRPTADCPRQFGNYPITKEMRYAKYDRCSSYISCASGIAHIMNCTFGLVFNPEINLCDWPEQVPGCQDVFEFRCPVPHLGEEDMVINYRYPTDPECRYFYSCLNGRYRVLACDEGLVFNSKIGRCVEDDQFLCDYENNYSLSLDIRRNE